MTTTGSGAIGSMEGLDPAAVVERQVLLPSGGGVPAGGPGGGEFITLSEQPPRGGPGVGDFTEPVAAGEGGAAPDSSRVDGSAPAGSGSAGEGTG
ncbi:hypothetical protein FNQ90_25685, partial [Streptomyces alkaliphilus]|nr:hypothetical protein [Streptomyces alkaliphilus]